MMSAFRRSSRRTTPSRTRRPRRAGFSLVALMVAMVLLGTGVMAIAAAQASSLRAQTDATARTIALAAARGYLEELRSRDPWTLDSEGSVSVDERGRPDPNGRFRRWTTVTTLRTNLVRVDVAVEGPRLAAPVVVGTHVYRGAAAVARP